MRFLVFAQFGMCFGLTLAAMGQLPAAPVVAAPPATVPPAAGAEWTYYGSKGPSNWGRLDPAYSACSKGKLQSPIDIRGAKVDPGLKLIEFHYVSGPVTMINTGHTIRVNVLPGSYILSGGTRYDLVEFHFHHPAEDLVNGKLSDLAINLVHKSATGELAIVLVRANEGRVNGSLAALWPRLPRTAGASVVIEDNFNPLGLLPGDRGYWSYPGSITVPPCTEGAHWLVMQTTTELSQEQLGIITRLYPDNARPVQPTHGRKIAASE